MSDALSRWCDLLARATGILNRAHEQDYEAWIRGEHDLRHSDPIPWGEDEEDDSYCRVEARLARTLTLIAAHRFQQAVGELRRDAVANFLAPKLDESKAMLYQLLALAGNHYVARDGCIASLYYEDNNTSDHVLRCVKYLKIQRRLKEATQQLAAWCPSPIDVDNAAQGGDEAEALPAESGPTPIAETDSGSVLLFDQSEMPIVKGNEKPTLTEAQYDVVLTLLQTGNKGLTKDELDRKSRRGDARKILKRLANSDSDWESVIPFPGTTGKGYRIV